MSTRGSLIIENRPNGTGRRYRWFYISSDAGSLAKRTLQTLVKWANESHPTPSLGAMAGHLRTLKHGNLFEPTENGEHPFDRDPKGRFSPFNEYEYRIIPSGSGYKLTESSPWDNQYHEVASLKEG